MLSQRQALQWLSALLLGAVLPLGVSAERHSRVQGVPFSYHCAEPGFELSERERKTVESMITPGHRADGKTVSAPTPDAGSGKPRLSTTLATLWARDFSLEVKGLVLVDRWELLNCDGQRHLREVRRVLSELMPLTGDYDLHSVYVRGMTPRDPAGYLDLEHAALVISLSQQAGGNAVGGGTLHINEANQVTYLNLRYREPDQPGMNPEAWLSQGQRQSLVRQALVRELGEQTVIAGQVDASNRTWMEEVPPQWHIVPLFDYSFVAADGQRWHARINGLTGEVSVQAHRSRRAHY